RDFLVQKRQLWTREKQAIRLQDAVDAVTFGVYDWQQEPSGRRFRWSSGTATIYVRHKATGLALPMRAPPSSTGVAKVTIAADARVQSEVVESDWRTLSVSLSSLYLPWRMHLVRLRVKPARVPAALDPRSADRRELGVELGEATTELSHATQNR